MVKSEVKILVSTSAILLGVTLVSLFILSSNIVSAETSSPAGVSVSVPDSCNINSTLDSAHSATIIPGTYQDNIGTTTFKVFCNDNAGFSVYAIGYSNEEYGNNKLLATVGGVLSPTNDIITGAATSGDVSQWAMKVKSVDGPYAPTIENNFNNYRSVPDIYTKIATFAASTDAVSGSQIQATYAAYVSGLQPAGTYQGKVKYTIVHPNDAKPPKDPRYVAKLDTGTTINVMMKNLANNTTNANLNTTDTKIKTIAKADALPANFTPVANNTISSSDSLVPAYIFFDDSTGTMYYYSEYDDIVLNRDAIYMFERLTSLTNIDALSSWDVSAVEDMTSMFSETSSLTNIDALSSWDTSAVTNMSGMFASASSLTNIDGAANWDTSAVTNMGGMFSNATSLANIDALSSWDTSAVTDMTSMFYAASSLTNIDGAANWDTSAVTNMPQMFFNVNNIDATVLNSWNVSNVTNKTDAFSCPADKRPSWY